MRYHQTDLWIAASKNGYVCSRISNSYQIQKEYRTGEDEKRRLDMCRSRAPPATPSGSLNSKSPAALLRDPLPHSRDKNVATPLSGADYVVFAIMHSNSKGFLVESEI